MADHRMEPSEQSSPSGNPADTPEEIQSVGNGKDAWIQNSLNQLHSQIEKIDGKLDSKFGKIDDRLRPIEKRINIAIGGIAVAVVVISILGWVLNPFLKAIADKMISGG